MSTGGSFLCVHCDLHKQRHLFCLDFSAGNLQSLFTEKLLVKEVVQRSFLFEKLLVVREIHGWENSFEKVASSKLFKCFSKTLFFFLRTSLYLWTGQTRVRIASSYLAFPCTPKNFLLEKTVMNTRWPVISRSCFFILQWLLLPSFLCYDSSQTK
jgi:hypothetical protein